MDQPFESAYQSIGLAHREPQQLHAARQAPAAGMTTAACAHDRAANDFPRFERQLMRTLQDPDIHSGAKQPHPELLRRHPARELSQGTLQQQPPRGGTVSAPSVSTFSRFQQRPGSGRSGRSGRSNASGRSLASSAGRSVLSSGSRHPAPVNPASQYYQQVPVRREAVHHFTTTSSAIGLGGHVAAEPQHGREVFNLGRGGGQQSSFDSCLVHKGHHVYAG